MNFKTISFILVLSLFIVSIGCVSASEINDNITISQDMPINTPDDFQDGLASDFQKSNESNVVTSDYQDSLQSTESDDVIVVNRETFALFSNTSTFLPRYLDGIGISYKPIAL